MVVGGIILGVISLLSILTGIKISKSVLVFYPNQNSSEADTAIQFILYFTGAICLIGSLVMLI